MTPFLKSPNGNHFPLEKIRVVDGDTLEADVKLGFGVTLSKRKIRLTGIDTPEVHTSRTLEKQAGILVAAYLAEKLGVHYYDDPAGACEDEADKYGRLLGRPHAGVIDLCSHLIARKFAHSYLGGTKEPWTDEELNNIIEELGNG